MLVWNFRRSPGLPPSASLCYQPLATFYSPWTAPLSRSAPPTFDHWHLFPCSLCLSVRLSAPPHWSHSPFYTTHLSATVTARISPYSLISPTVHCPATQLSLVSSAVKLGKAGLIVLSLCQLSKICLVWVPLFTFYLLPFLSYSLKLNPACFCGFWSCACLLGFKILPASFWISSSVIYHLFYTHPITIPCHTLLRAQ